MNAELATRRGLLGPLFVALVCAACGGGGGGGGDKPVPIGELLARDFVDVVHLTTAGSRTLFDVESSATGAYPCEQFVSYAYAGSTEFMDGSQEPFGSRTVMEGDTVVAFLVGRDFPDEEERRSLQMPNWFSNPPCIAVENSTTMMHADLTLLGTDDDRVVVGRILDEPDDEGNRVEPFQMAISDLMEGLTGEATGDRAAAAKVRGITLIGWPPEVDEGT